MAQLNEWKPSKKNTNRSNVGVTKMKKNIIKFTT